MDEIVVRLTLARAIVSADAERMREQLKPLLTESISNLANCFRALQRFGQDERPEPVMIFENGTPAYLMAENGPLTVMCTVHDPGEYYDLRSEFPTLRLRAISHEDGTEDRLYVPIRAVR